MMDDSPLTWHGRPALTIRLAADRYGISPDHLRKTLHLLRGRGAVQPIAPPPIDRRAPLYWQDELDAAMAARPGRGANLRGR